MTRHTRLDHLERRYGALGHRDPIRIRVVRIPTDVYGDEGAARAYIDEHPGCTDRIIEVSAQ